MKPEWILCLALLTSSILHADDYANLFRQAAEDTQNARYQQAILKYKAALTLRPGAPEALNNLAAMYYQLHQYSAAFETAAPLWKSHPELPSAALVAGLAAVQCDRPKDAVAPLKFLLAHEPANRDAQLGLASAHLALMEFPDALAIYEHLIAASNTDAMAWYGAAICYERVAENASRTLSHIAGGSAYSKRLLAEYLQNAGDTKLAAEAFGESQSTPAVPSSPEAERPYQIARDAAEKSRNAFEHFVNLAPDSWQAAVFLGDVERQHGNLTAALTNYRKAAQSQPNNPAALLGMGTAYWELGDFDKATACLHKLLAVNPRSPQAIFELANIAVRQHRDTDAIPLLEQYLAEQPDASAAHADLGRAYLHLGQDEKAIAELQEAADSDQQGDIHFQLSTALRRMGKVQEADAAARKSADLRASQLRREQSRHDVH